MSSRTVQSAETRDRPKRAPLGEEVTTSDYFSSKKKGAPSTPNTKKAHQVDADDATTSPEMADRRRKPSGKTSEQGVNSHSKIGASSGHKDKTAINGKHEESVVEKQSEKQVHTADDGQDSGEDIFRDEYKQSKALDEYEPEEEEEVLSSTRKKTARGRKRKSAALSDEEDGQATKHKKAGKKTPSKPSASKKPRTPAKDKKVEEDAGIQSIFNQIPTIRAPTPPSQDASKKFDFASRAARSRTAPNAGSKEIPVGAEQCLSGLTFVFTGLLDALGREEGQDLVKRYGGKVTSGPSSKTNYVVLGTDAGPKKLETIQKYQLKTINEEGLFALIRTLPAFGGSGQAATKAEEKRQAEEKKIRDEAEKQEQELAAEMEKKAQTPFKPGASNARSVPQPVRLDDQLWTVKYAPKQLTQICGNKVQVERLQSWLRNWSKNAKVGFRKGGPDGLGLYRAVMIHGNPGIGKTTAAHLVAKLEGYDIVESNASDTRSKKLIETGLKGVLDATSLFGYFSADGSKANAARRRLVLIMDEVDGMSAGDRGGVGAMASICKKTSVPIILICNDRKAPKMKPFDSVTFDLPFRKPTTDQVRSRIMTILFREGLSKLVPGTAVNALIEGSGADIRRIINMISTAKLEQQAMDFDEGKRMSNAWEKNIILRPWDVVQKILAGGLFASSSKVTLNDKAELYFNDHEFSYLMLQENYLKTNPILAGSLSGREKALKVLNLIDKAAESISDGDLVDSLIHGQQQHWSLMPMHAMFSFVRPASYISGSLAGNSVQFTTWLGNNSKQGMNAVGSTSRNATNSDIGKLTRFVKDVQGHMRLRASGDRHEIRQQYLPLLWDRLVKVLELHGSDPQCIENVINLMDSYYLTKDDWDAILELGVGPQDAEKVKLPTQVKSNFTRKYNALNHPLPFIKAGAGVPATKAPKVKPDLEEAIEESDDELVANPTVDDNEGELDLKKDKYVKETKKRKAAAKKTNKAAASASTEEDSSENSGPQPKKARTKGSKGATKAGKAKAKN